MLIKFEINFCLLVAAAPSFDKGSVEPGEFTTALKSGTAVISCQPIGSPKPEVTWYKGRTMLGPSGDKYSVSKYGTLKIFNVEKNDRDTYTCVGRNGFGMIKKDTYLIVKGDLYT